MLYKLNLHPLGGQVSVAQLFSAADQDGNGRIAFDEFVALMANNPTHARVTR